MRRVAAARLRGRLVARGDDSPADIAAATAAVERLHSEVDDLLKQMNVDARTASDAVARKKLLARVELYQRGIKALRAEFVRAKEDAARKKEEDKVKAAEKKAADAAEKAAAAAAAAAEKADAAAAKKAEKEAAKNAPADKDAEKEPVADKK